MAGKGGAGAAGGGSADLRAETRVERSDDEEREREGNGDKIVHAAENTPRHPLRLIKRRSGSIKKVLRTAPNRMSHRDQPRQ